MRYVVFILVALLAVAGCGGGDEAADAGTDVDRLVRDTFANTSEIESGKVDLSARVDAEVAIAAKVTGAFESQGDGKLPKVDLDASFEGGGERVEAGVINTGDEAFVSFQGIDYEVSGLVLRQLQAAYEEAAKDGKGASLATLGLDPRNWLTDARNAGESEVGGTETIKITGGVDVPKLLDDLNSALERTRSLGLQGSDQLPEKLSDAQKRRAADSVDDVGVEIHTGKDDRILRRLAIDAKLTAPEGSDLGGGAESATLRFDLSLLDVNEDQDIEAPDDARPFQELLKGLEGLGLGVPGAGADSGGGASPKSLEEYSDCVKDAGGDAEKLRECSGLLTP